jgi:hypothetical protein
VMIDVRSGVCLALVNALGWLPGEFPTRRSLMFIILYETAVI